MMTPTYPPSTGFLWIIQKELELRAITEGLCKAESVSSTVIVFTSMIDIWISGVAIAALVMEGKA